jgi:hypothetical protein
MHLRSHPNHSGKGDGDGPVSRTGRGCDAVRPAKSTEVTREFLGNLRSHARKFPGSGNFGRAMLRAHLARTCRRVPSRPYVGADERPSSGLDSAGSG